MPYTPTVPPEFQDVSELRQWLAQELQRIAEELAETTVVELRPIFAAPSKPREGMIVSADGTSWNPGAGAGAYERKGGAWVKL
jgi:hypothetical protein